MNIPRFSVRNPVAANFLMAFIVLTGLHFWFNLVREFFPNADPEQVVITIPYPGATPEEVEKSVTKRVEREIDNVDDVEEIDSRILEGVTVITVTMDEGADRDRVLSDLRGELDRVKPDLPEGTEDPEIREVRPFVPVIGVVIHGDVGEERLHEATLDVRDELLDLPGVSEVVLSGLRDREIWAEVRPEKLEEYGLTFEEVGRVIAGGNLDVPGGQLRGDLGNMRVRTLGEQDRARDIENLVVRSGPDGTAVRLRDVAVLRETFEDRVERGRFARNDEGSVRGRPAGLVTVFKTPEQDAIKISRLVKDFVKKSPTRLGGAVKLTVTTDLARFIEQRLELMVRNARLGVVLVLLSLAFFLDLRVAFWVGSGLAISFLGTFTAMHVFGATINLISLFGLIVVLGMIVDDAIVIGENVYTKLDQGMPGPEAAIAGASEVAMPVVAAVLTTMAAFAPLFFIEGRIGTFMGVLPIVVICALGVSLFEAFAILPAHLAHGSSRRKKQGRFRAWRRKLLDVTLPRHYERCLRFVLAWRYPAMAAALALSLFVAGLPAGGIIPFVLLQETDAETVSISLEMAAGTPEEKTLAMIQSLEEMVLRDDETKTVFSSLGTTFGTRGRVVPADPATVGQLVVELTPADQREAEGKRTSKKLVTAWREATMGIPGVSQLSINPRGGGPQGPDIEVRLRGEEMESLEPAVEHVRSVLARYDGVSQIEDDLTLGKLEIRLRLKDSARSLGLDTRNLALQIRHALYGFEAQDLQGDEEEITVRAVLPEAARRGMGDLSRLRIATPRGERVPLSEVAGLTTARGYAQLARVDGKRAVTVTAEVDEDRTNTEEVTNALKSAFATLGDRFPGVSASFEGRKKETRESLGSLKIGFPAALVLIYGIIAILFRSYFQPFIVMAAIPYAFVGAVLGHLVMGYPFTILSMIGGVALAGIVVNDSLILVDFINRKRREGMAVIEAVVAGGRARLRPILLTSVTTIFGIGPLMLERSFQAQFLIPMAVSIVFGLAFATALTLILLPTLYLAFEDLKGALRWLFTGEFAPRTRRTAAPVPEEQS